jgi:hypothetical protein
MKLRFKLCAAVLLVLFAATPVFASGTECKKCFSTFDPDSSQVVFSCLEPNDNQWGMSSCNITCTRYGNSVYCDCTESGWGCLYIVVQG